MSELRGQIDIGEILPEDEALRPIEGYDAEGRLLDYAPEAGPSAEAKGERPAGVDAPLHCDGEILKVEPQTSAESRRPRIGRRCRRRTRSG